MIDGKRKADIDAMSYEELLRLNRFAPIGAPYFQGESGEYILRRLRELRIGGADHVAASKKIGWDQPSREDVQLLSPGWEQDRARNRTTGE